MIVDGAKTAADAGTTILGPMTAGCPRFNTVERGRLRDSIRPNLGHPLVENEIEATLRTQASTA